MSPFRHGSALRRCARRLRLRLPAMLHDAGRVPPIAMHVLAPLPSQSCTPHAPAQVSHQVTHPACPIATPLPKCHTPSAANWHVLGHACHIPCHVPRVTRSRAQRPLRVFAIRRVRRRQQRGGAAAAVGGAPRAARLAPRRARRSAGGTSSAAVELGTCERRRGVGGHCGGDAQGSACRLGPAGPSRGAT